MRRLGAMLPDSIEQAEVLRSARARRTLRRWEEIVGPELYGRSRPDRFDKGTVWVAVQGSAWAQELRMIKELILRRLCDTSGEPALFTDVRFGVRPLPEIDLTVATEQEPVQNDVRDLSIGQIAARRRELWTDDRTSST